MKKSPMPKPNSKTQKKARVRSAGKKPNPAAQALGRLGGLARAKNHTARELSNLSRRSIANRKPAASTSARD